MQSVEERLEAQQQQLDAIYESVEKTRKYFLAIIWITVVTFVVPLVGIVIAIPILIGQYSNLLAGF